MANTYMTKAEAGMVREKKQVIVDRELDKLYRKHKTITTAMVLDAARAEDHPLHKYIEWDDAKAADKFRHAQVYAMIQASRFMFVLDGKDNAKPNVVHAQASVRRLLPTFKGEGFKMRNEVLSEEETRAAFIEKKKESLRAWCRSVVDVEELAELRADILARVGEG